MDRISRRGFQTVWIGMESDLAILNRRQIPKSSRLQNSRLPRSPGRSPLSSVSPAREYLKPFLESALSLHFRDPSAKAYHASPVRLVQTLAPILSAAVRCTDCRQK